MRRYKGSKYYSRIFTVFTALLLGVSLFWQSSFAQGTTNAPDRGLGSGKSYSISDIESIAMQSGNMMVNVPLGSLPAGRAGISAGISLTYNSKLYDQQTMEDLDSNGTEVERSMLNVSEEGGWHYGYKYYLRLDYVQGDCTAGVNQQLNQIRIQLVMPDGGTHTMIPIDGTSATSNEGDASPIFPDGRSACDHDTPVTPGQTVTLFSVDNSFLRMEVTTDGDVNVNNNQWTLYAPDGTRIVNLPGGGVSQRIYDRNNNYIDLIENAADTNYSGHKTATLVDTVGRKVVLEYNAATAEDHIHSSGVAGAAITTRVKWKVVVVDKTYVAGEFEAASPHPGTYWSAYNFEAGHRVVDKIYLPSQIGGDLHYEFGYNADATSGADDFGWGEINEIKLPSGAKSKYEYVYDTVTGGLATAGKILSNGVKKKTLEYNLEYDGVTTLAPSEVWTYARTYAYPSGLEGVPWARETALTAPDGGVTKEYYGTTETEPQPPTAPTFLNSEIYKTEMPDGTVIEKWYQNNTPAVSNTTTYKNSLFKANRYVKYEFVSIPNNTGAPVKTATKEYTRDKNGNVIEVKEYDFAPYTGAGSVPRDSFGRPYGPPSTNLLARVTKTDYYYDTPEASTATYTDADSYYKLNSPRLLRLVKSAEVHAWDIQSSITVPKSRTEMYYDNPALVPTNGNLTSTKVWDSKKGAHSSSLNSGSGGNAISTSVVYNSYGMPTATTDAKGVETTITYGCINGNGSCEDTPWLKDLYPTKTETASNYPGLKRTSTAVYDFYTGVTTSMKDVDNNVTSATYYDALGRPTKVAAAVGTALEVWTQTDYYDSVRKVVVKSDLETKGDARRVSAQFYDQLGRVRLSKTLENSATQDPTNETDGIKVQTRYKMTSGYTYQLTSNPYRATTSSGTSNEESMGWTRSKTVNTGRHSEVETFAGVALPAPFATSGDNTDSTGKVQTDLDADRTLVTDQTGKKRISRTSALGQLTDVWEILAAADSGTSVSVTFPTGGTTYHSYHTSYQYDLLGNLTKVRQPIGTTGGQTRDFTYSSLSRLLTANNPESGTISYNYDDNGNMTSKIDARTITTTYQYDVLNRVINRSYTGSSTPSVAYTYDDPNIASSKGKLTKVESSVSKTEYTEFDILGKVKKSKQTTDLNVAEMEYVYNLSGALVEQKYPSGRVVKNILDNNGELEAVRSKKNANYGFWNYAANFTYTAAGAVSSMQLGNFKWESTTFNSRLQPTQIALGTTQNATNVLDLDYSYGTTQNNGNVSSQTIIVQTAGAVPGFSAIQTYNYDSLNRLKDATENLTPTGGSSVQTWKQTFTYDRFGNRNFDEADTTADLLKFPKECGVDPNKTMCAVDRKVFNPEVLHGDNRFKSDQDSDGTDDYLYDAGGNTTRAVEKTPSGIELRKFTYDAENKQTKVEMINSSGTVTGIIGEYSYDGDGKRVKKYVPSTGETTIFIYDASGKLVEEYSSVVETTNAKVSYLTNDHLGSPRITTDRDGQTISRRDFQPFGEEIVTSQRTQGLGYTDDSIRQKFTSYERDGETELDFAQARMYKKELGRFTSVDPMLSSGKIGSPQTWNRYTYVLGNPLVFVDPTGMFVWGQSLGGSQKKEQLEKTEEGRAILEKRNQIINNINALRSLTAEVATARGLTNAEFADIQRAVNSYGGEDISNGVVVEFGNVSGSAVAEVISGRDSANKQQFFRETVDNSGNVTGVQANVVVTFENVSSSSFADTIIHEGNHIANRQALAAEYTREAYTNGNAEYNPLTSTLNLTKYENENRAYTTEANYVRYRQGNTDISQRGWSPADRQTAINNKIRENYRDSRNNRITPQNQGERMYQVTTPR